jgi:hypothetical protein
MSEPKNTVFVARAQSVLRRIEIYEKSNGQEISASDLEYARRQIQALIESAQAATLPPRESRFHYLTRMIVDHWPFNNKLGNDIAALEAEYDRL